MTSAHLRFERVDDGPQAGPQPGMVADGPLPATPCPTLQGHQVLEQTALTTERLEHFAAGILDARRRGLGTDHAVAAICPDLTEGAPVTRWLRVCACGRLSFHYREGDALGDTCANRVEDRARFLAAVQDGEAAIAILRDTARRTGGH